MEPPLGSQGCRLVERQRAYTSGRAAFRAQRRSGPGSAMFSRFPSPGPVWADASPAPERFARLRRLSPGLAFVVPARHRRGRRFPTASRFGCFPPFAGERKTLTNP